MIRARFLATVLWLAASANVSAIGEGFGIQRQPEPGGRTRLEILDSASGRRLVSIFGPDGGMELLEERTAGGRLLDRREFQGERLFHEKMPHGSGDLHEKLWVEPESEGRFQLIRWTRKGTAAPRTRIERVEAADLFSAEAREQVCKPPASDLESALHIVDWAKIAPRAEEPSGRVPLGYSFVADPTCARYPGGGHEQLAKILKEALRKGVSCLQKLGPERAMDAARVMTLVLGPNAPLSEREKSLVPLTKPVRLFCARAGEEIPVLSRNRAGRMEARRISLRAGEYGLSFPGNDALFPAVLLNLSVLKEGSEGVLFHELLHLTGYLHDGSLDLPYLAEYCCFGKGNSDSRREEQASSCHLLKDADVEAGSYEYGAAFTQAMGTGGAFLTRNILLRGARAEPRQSAAVQGYASFITTYALPDDLPPEKRRRNGWLLESRILGKAMHGGAKGYVPPGVEAAFPSSKENDPVLRFSDAMAEAVAAIQGGDLARYRRAQIAMRYERVLACTSFFPQEREKVREIARDLEPSLWALTRGLAAAESLELTGFWREPCPERR